MTTALMMAAWLICVGQTPGADLPPPLTFDKPVDYIAWSNELVQRGKKDNAIELYRGLWTDAKGLPSAGRLADQQLSKALRQAWSGDEFPELKAYLQRCEPYTDILKMAAKKPDCWQPVPSNLRMLLEFETPGLINGREASQAILAHSLMRQDRQAQVITEGCQVVLRHADHMHQLEWLVPELLSVSERMSVYQTARAALADDLLSGKEIEKLYGTIRRFDVAADRPAKWLQLEWAMQLDTLQFICPEGKFDAKRWDEAMGLLVAGDRPPSTESPPFDPLATARQADDYFEGIAKILTGPLSARTAMALGDYERNKRAIRENHAYFKLTLSRFTEMYKQILQGETHRRGTLLALALCGYKAKHGTWPDSLAAIDAKSGFDGVDSLREDPYSGKDFVYRIKEGQPLLYSVGPDGKDNEGRQDDQSPEGMDYVFWPYQRL